MWIIRLCIVTQIAYQQFKPTSNVDVFVFGLFWLDGGIVLLNSYVKRMENILVWVIVMMSNTQHKLWIKRIYYGELHVSSRRVERHHFEGRQMRIEKRWSSELT